MGRWDDIERTFGALRISRDAERLLEETKRREREIAEKERQAAEAFSHESFQAAHGAMILATLQSFAAAVFDDGDYYIHGGVDTWSIYGPRIDVHGSWSYHTSVEHCIGTPKPLRVLLIHTEYRQEWREPRPPYEDGGWVENSYFQTSWERWCYARATDLEEALREHLRDATYNWYIKTAIATYPKRRK